VGESFWPATLNHPYGETVLIGDDSLRHELQLARVVRFVGVLHAWLPGRGIRADRLVRLADADPAQTIILKQEDRAFYGGRTVSGT